MKYPQILFGANMAFLRDALLDVGGFRTDLGRRGRSLLSGKEVDVFKKLNERQLEILYHPDIIVHHLVPKERLLRKWLYRRAYWGRRSETLMLADMSRGVILKEAGTSLQKIVQKSVRLYRIRNKADSSVRVSIISSIYREAGRILQLLSALGKRGLPKKTQKPPFI